jgi:hypothetical protein
MDTALDVMVLSSGRESRRGLKNILDANRIDSRSGGFSDPRAKPENLP